MNSILKHLAAAVIAATAVFGPAVLTAPSAAAETTCPSGQGVCINSDPWDA